MIPKHQLFNDNKSEQIVPIVYKHQRFDEYKNKKKQNLNKNKDNGDRDKYVYSASIAFPLFPPKRSNCMSDLDKRTKSPIYLVSISKNYWSEKS